MTKRAAHAATPLALLSAASTHPKSRHALRPLPLLRLASSWLFQGDGPFHEVFYECRRMSFLHGLNVGFRHHGGEASHRRLSLPLPSLTFTHSSRGIGSCCGEIWRHLRLARMRRPRRFSMRFAPFPSIPMSGMTSRGFPVSPSTKTARSLSSDGLSSRLRSTSRFPLCSNTEVMLSHWVETFASSLPATKRAGCRESEVAGPASHCIDATMSSSVGSPPCDLNEIRNVCPGI